ncbi:MAG TPA: hypothetical protein VF050_06415 [Moraxellaceae bacterium]
MKSLLKQPRLQALSAAVLATGLLTGASQSWASTAATSTVRNVVTVAYNNASGTAQTPLVAAVDVTVNLVPAAATLSAPTDITTAPNAPAVYSYDITNGANGIATYSLSSAVTAQSNISGSTTAPSVASVTLGATTLASSGSTTIAAAGTTSLTVPRDSTADSSVNGIAAGDTVVIGTAVYTVASVVDAQVPASPAVGAFTTTITLNGNGTAQTVAPGTLIFERQTFTVSVTPGTMTSTTDATIDVTLTTTNGTNPSTDGTVTTVAAVGLSVTKLVRNFTTNAAGTGTAVAYGGATYYPSGVGGVTGDVLEYLIVVSKSNSANNATSVSVTDPIPVFTTFVTAAYGAASGLAIDNTNSGTFTNISNAADADAGEIDGSGNVVFRPGTTAGTMGASATSRMKFQVTIQ